MTRNGPGAALVTGASQRIGRAIAIRLADAGYAVAVHCRKSKHEAESLASEIEKAGGRAAILVADLADDAAVARLVADAAKALGPLTLLVNSAAVFEPDQIGSLTRERWDLQFAVNLVALPAQVPFYSAGVVIAVLCLAIISGAVLGGLVCKLLGDRLLAIPAVRQFLGTPLAAEG